jgi:ribonuclease inhibitor
MKTIQFETDAANLNELHEQISLALGFPDYYGYNLDALYDCLSSDVELPIKFIWKHVQESAHIAGLEDVLDVFRDYAHEEPDFHFEEH